MRRGILLFVLSMYGCALQIGGMQSEADVLKLDFEDDISEASYQLLLRPPEGFKLSRIQEDQFYEYRLVYADKSTFYISGNIYDGSRLNAQNRYDQGIRSYSANRTLYDTIRNAGVQSNQKYWLEWINGKYAIGYVNAPDSIKFLRSLENIQLVENP